MATEPNPTDRTPPRRKMRARRVARALAITMVIVLLAAAAGVAFVASEAGLAMAARILISRSEGRLHLDSPSGSLLSAIRIKHLEWRGPGATLTADDIAVNWTPFALLSRGIVVEAVGARRMTLAIEPSDSAIALPVTLALPTTVTIGEVAVAEFEWTIGKNSGRITGFTFGYEGSPAAHRVERLQLVLESGKVSGNATVGANAPYAVKGAFAFDGEAQQQKARADVVLDGTIDAVRLEAQGRAGDARFVLNARLTPLAAVAFDQLALEANDLDLRAWHAALPATRLDVRAEGRPADGGIAGRFEAQNAIAGPLDADRLPLRAVAARFAWRPAELALDDLVATVGRGGRITGSAQVPLARREAGKWTLEALDIDLNALYSTLAQTRLSGSVVADLDATRQRFEGRVADRRIVGGVSASFAATLVERKLAVERFQVRAADGEVVGRATIDFTARRPFELTATAKHIDPSRFGKFPAGKLDGTIDATGTLDPAWQVAAKAAIAAGSQLAGVPLAGHLHATLAPHTLRDASIDVTLASARLTANGSFGAAEPIAVMLDAPRIGELAPLLPARAPKPVSGSLRVNASLRGDLEHGGFELQAHGDALKIGAGLAFASADARISVAPAAATTTAPATQLDQRPVHAEVVATGVVAQMGTFPRAHASVEGTLAQHKATLAFSGEDLDVEASAHGGLRDTHGAAGATSWTWAGFVDTLENRGPWPMKLEAPAAVEVANERVRIGEARLRLADGAVHVAALALDQGRISTRGTFTGVPVATVAKLAAVKLPFESTMTLGGDWSLAAAPRLNGTVTVRREQGDLSFASDTGLAATDRAFRVTSAEVSARFTDDAVEAAASIRSQRGSNVDAKASLGVAPGAPPGHLSPDAPLRVALNADLATLRVLQPWLGTTAVIDGRAHAELVARGTLARAPWSGTVRAEAVRIQAPQYGVLFTEGRVNARLAEGTIELDELELVGGAGRFTASGTLATSGAITADGEGVAAQMTWRAEKFRVLNRPDLRLVVGGSGTLRLKEKKLSLEGALVADEGHFEYKPDPAATLGEDVVVKGWQAREDAPTRRPSVPLLIDLDLDFGRNLNFVGEGLETGLRGKVRVTTAADGTLRGRGSIQTVNGVYYAFGQRLVIDRGRLIFDGPVDNPGLDIVALRKGLAVEAGVAITGTVKVPIIQLTSNPPVPDNEKLSWLVLGQGIDRTSSADMAALQAASAALLGQGGKPVTATVAQSIGLDDISIGRGATSTRSNAPGSADAANQVVSFGKRINDRLMLVYEQGLTVAKNALRLEYALTRTLTLRAEAGVVSSFGIYYRKVFD